MKTHLDFPETAKDLKSYLHASRLLRLAVKELERLRALPDENKFKPGAIERVQQQADRLEHILLNW